MPPPHCLAWPLHVLHRGQGAKRCRLFQGTLNKWCNSSLDTTQALKQSFSWAQSSSVPLAALEVQRNPGWLGLKVPGHPSSVSRGAAEFWRAESGGNSLSAAGFALELQNVSVHVPLRAQFFYLPPRLFKTSCLCKWTGGSHIWVTRLLEVIERLQNGACLILLFQKFSHMYSRQLCLLNEFIKFQKSFEILTYQKNMLKSFHFF